MGTCPQSSLSSSILLCLLVEILIQVRQLSAISKKPSSRSQVDNITNDFWSWRLRQSPEFATSLGVHQFNDKLELFTTAAFQRRKEKCDGLINKIDAILDEKTMSSNDFYNLWVLRLDLSSFLSGYKWARLSMLNPLNIIEGIHRDASFWLDALPFESETDVTNYLSRLSALASQIDEHIALMQQAVDIGWTNYETSMTSVLTQLSTLTNSVTEAVLFVKPLNESLDNIPLPIYKREQIYDEAYAVIENQLLPRYKRLSYFLTEVYMPATRKEPGISSLDEGSNFYKACLHWYLSYEENIEDLLALGYDHLNQIIKRLEQIRFSERHNGDLDSFFHHLRSSNSFFFHHEKELVQRYKELVLYELPHSIHKFFFHTRLGRFSVQPMLFNGPSAFMMPGSDDGAMSPVFFVNVRNLNKQPKWRVKSAVLRETLPGRYFQNSYIANQSLASFRRWREYRKMYSVPFQFPFYTAFTEGWTLYAESLGVDMNITDPYDECGILISRLQKVVEMLIDINIHLHRWPRSRAIKFMSDTLRLSAADVAADVDRIITFPAQAVAPFYGYANIKEMRAHAEKNLGANFDVRLFHHHILKNGPVPIQLLYIEMSKWISHHRLSQQALTNSSYRKPHLTLLDRILFVCLYLLTFSLFRGSQLVIF